MHDPLTDVEVRVLGALAEKAMTTPEYYPLSLNALVNACNQSSNRDPVVQYDEETVTRAIEGLRRRALVRAIKKADARVTKYQHLMGESWDLDARQVAVLCVLMLRGPQTVGELKARTARLAESTDVSEVESALNGLAEREGSPFVARLPRRPGQKEARYAQVLAGDVTDPAPDAPEVRLPDEADRVSALEERVKDVMKDVADLRAQLEAFRRQFE